MLLAPAVLTGCAGRTALPMPASHLVGRSAPDFTLPTPEGRPVHLASTNGKVRVVDFWATWCPICVEELPRYRDLQQKYGSKGLQIIAISMDQNGAKTVRAFAAKNKMPWTVLMAAPGTADDWDIGQGLPSTFLLDRDGTVITHWPGAKSMDDVEAAVKAAL